MQDAISLFIIKPCGTYDKLKLLHTFGFTRFTPLPPESLEDVKSPPAGACYFGESDGVLYVAIQNFPKDSFESGLSKYESELDILFPGADIASVYLNSESNEYGYAIANLSQKIRYRHFSGTDSQEFGEIPGFEKRFLEKAGKNNAGDHIYFLDGKELTEDQMGTYWLDLFTKEMTGHSLIGPNSVLNKIDLLGFQYGYELKEGETIESVRQKIWIYIVIIVIALLALILLKRFF